MTDSVTIIVDGAKCHVTLAAEPPWLVMIAQTYFKISDKDTVLERQEKWWMCVSYIERVCC